MSYGLGVDVGGTFTDFIVLDEQTGEIMIGKRLTTPRDPSESILAGTEELVQAGKVSAGAIGRIVHGTTLVTNTIIERSGVCTAVLTTRGFRDTLTIGRPLRYDMYDLFLEYPPPLVPRHLRFEVDERVGANGEVLLALDEEGVLDAARAAVDQGAVSLAICFLHSYRNPRHEQRARQIVAEAFPDLAVSLSSDVVGEIGEYDRASTTAANAYVQPLMAGYLARLRNGLETRSVKAPLRLMLSSGGITTVEMAQALPIQLIESGPAGGAIAAAHVGKLCDEANILSFDMGGTTAKMCLITDGAPAHSSSFEAARIRRFMRGSGLPLRVPVVELIEIGAGGGSIAAVDAFGLLKVGPQSAGAMPGPVCYGRGGTQPTVTDADVVLGYVDPDSFLGGQMRLDIEAARRAIDEKIAGPLGVDVIKAAAGIHQVVNEMMASATRVYASERGCDPRAYTMMAFGGAGPVHALALARLLKMSRLICPKAAGAASALGFLVAPASLDLAQSYVARLGDLKWEHLVAIYDEMEERARAALHGAGIASRDITFHRSVEMSYVGQGFQIPVTLSREMIDAGDPAALEGAFADSYTRLYGRPVTNIAVQALTWRLTATGPVPTYNPGRIRGADGEMLKGRRRIYMVETGTFEEVPVLNRYAMAPGTTFEGPAVIEERESSLVLGSACLGRVDDALNLVIDIPQPGGH